MAMFGSNMGRILQLDIGKIQAETPQSLKQVESYLRLLVKLAHSGQQTSVDSSRQLCLEQSQSELEMQSESVPDFFLDKPIKQTTKGEGDKENGLKLESQVSQKAGFKAQQQFGRQVQK